ncbi:AraC family transcriptional regulator [Maricaulis maris]|uniref:AraC family transcriptional regulator n=1 Tax=Maricaulis maris TaxID=74318 RepID=A0A495D461_9PROT|nr:GyrI-like domain-containing protein [Maricaulis maris]RKQ95569.1 AraC family transcriptional regulator [Maricaulis maris]
MMPDSRLRHAERIERVLAHIEQADSEAGLSVEALAAVAALSPYHFHRVYRLMTGETPGDTIRRVRLARTVPELQNADQSITRAAGGAGYGSSQSYARAFRAATGGSASDVRAGRVDLIDQLLRPAHKGGGEAVPLAVEIVSTAPLRLLAIRNIGAYAELNQAYERLFASVFSQHPMDALRGIYGVWHEDPRFTDPAGLHFDCAIAVGDIEAPDGIELIALAGGDHARLRHVGDYDSLHDSIDRLYAAVLDGGLGRFADRPLHVEYVDDPDSRPAAELRSDIYLPIERA